MSQKYLFVASKDDLAGINITTQLSQYPGLYFHLVDGPVIETSSLNLDRINQFDFIIFCSKHQSEKKEKTISIHAPGNFREAQLGGQLGKLCKSSALFNKYIFEILNKTIRDLDLRNYKLTLEVTHHGPLIDKPCVFVEIGSTEREWKDKRAGFIVARAIKETIETFKENPYHEIAIGIGGPHYCPSFNNIQLGSNVALSHIIPKYAEPITEEMIKESVSKTIEEVDFVLLDWKGISGEEERKKIIKIMNKNHLEYRKTNEIKKG
jgi:D-aminoacyl-tRNA deacylase